MHTPQAVFSSSEGLHDPFNAPLQPLTCLLCSSAHQCLPSAPLGCPERAAGITPGLVWIITAQPWAQLGHQGSQDTGLAWSNSSESCLKGPIGFKVEHVCVIWKV